MSTQWVLHDTHEEHDNWILLVPLTKLSTGHLCVPVLFPHNLLYICSQLWESCDLPESRYMFMMPLGHMIFYWKSNSSQTHDSSDPFVCPWDLGSNKQQNILVSCLQSLLLLSLFLRLQLYLKAQSKPFLVVCNQRLLTQNYVLTYDMKVVSLAGGAVWKPCWEVAVISWKSGASHCQFYFRATSTNQ